MIDTTSFWHSEAHRRDLLQESGQRGRIRRLKAEQLEAKKVDRVVCKRTESNNLPLLKQLLAALLGH